MRLGRYRRKRVYHIIVLLGIAGVVFLIFQLFSLEVLSFHTKSESRRVKNSFVSDWKKKDTQIHSRDTQRFGQAGGPKLHVVDEDCVGGKCQVKDSDIIDNVHVKQKYEGAIKNRVEKYKLVTDNRVERKHIRQTSLKPLDTQKPFDTRAECTDLAIGADENTWDFLEKCFVSTPEGQTATRATVRGVHPSWSHVYQPTTENKFICLKSKEVISFDRVNDDYCDCSDSTDEPGTSACQGSRFYCTFQLSFSSARWISSVKVDDGLCDCCDGSDEPSQHLLANHVKLKENRPFFGVRQAPCTDQCQALRRQEQERREMQSRAAKMKLEYISAAQGVPNPNDKYGPDGEFYRLSQECYREQFDKYIYEVCPFREVKQTWSTLPFKNLGRDGKWVSTGKNGWRLLMGHGEPTQCPGAKARITYILFFCGEKDEITNISETEVCEYTIRFNTPAAC